MARWFCLWRSPIRDLAIQIDSGTDDVRIFNQIWGARAPALMRLDSTGRVADTHYSIVSEGEAQWARAYDPGGDGDLYAGRSGGGFWGPPGGYYEQGNGFVPPGSVYGPPRRAGLFGEIFGGGDQRYYEQQEMARQRQRRVDPDYFMNRWQTN